MRKSLSIVILLFGFSVLKAQNVNIIEKDVAKLLEKKREYNNSAGFGYMIQIFNGNETRAKSKQARFKILYPRVKLKLVYDAPEWKVQVGNYKTMLEADRAMLIFRKEFSGVIPVPMGK